MISIQSIALIALTYLLLLFLIAYWGDSRRSDANPFLNTNVIYALSLAVYCSSWTFYGAVGTASVIGVDFIPIYLGPCIVFMFGYPVMRRIITVCKQYNITSISDFISSRYGKSRRIAVLVTVIAVVGSLPYIALQLKAVSMSFLVLSEHANASSELSSVTSSSGVAFYTSCLMALFAILFGTRHLNAAEHHAGMVLAISFESIVKLVAILIVGFYAAFLLLDKSTVGHFSEIIVSGTNSYNFSSGSSTWASFLTKTILSMGAIILLPRQFQMTVVEADNHQQFKTAMWVMPLYLLLTTLIVIPIAFAGTTLLPEGNADLYVLSLPLVSGNHLIGLVAFIGGLSAATGMVIVSVISLSTMISNDLIMPNLIRVKRLNILDRSDLNSIILSIRRIAIGVLIAGAYGYFKLMDSNAQLANIGLISFAAVIQFLPAVLCAVYWKKAQADAVYWGLFGGFIVWAYTLMLPTILTPTTVTNIWSETSWLNPQSLFGAALNDSLTHGVFWSLLVNISLLVILSIRNQQSLLERIQASRFFFSGVEVSDTQSIGQRKPILIHPDALRVVAERIIGIRNTKSVFSQYEAKNKKSISNSTAVDPELISLTQTAIAGVIGTASAQKVISDIVIGDEEYLDEVTSMVDETSTVLQFNRNLLQATLQNITHGISVIDENMNLVVWNQRYLDLFEYPENFIFIGKPIAKVLEYNAERGDFEGSDQKLAIQKRLHYLRKRQPFKNVRKRSAGRIIKSTGEPMPNGGFVTTYEDITESVNASELLRQANEELEDRVAERTHELSNMTEALEKTTLSKTHFLAAASHDLLQPINSARIFAHSILERSEGNEEIVGLSENIDRALVTANQLLRALLDISKLDASGIEPNLTVFDLKEVVKDLFFELDGSALEKNIELKSDIQSIPILSDRELLFSVLQNLITNAIRYTPDGGNVVVAIDQAAHSRSLATISVIDNGVGIDKNNLDKIFNEFYQINTSGIETRVGALGLGLSIVQRISRLLNLRIRVESTKGEGSIFSIDVPVSDQEVPLRSSVPQKKFILPAEKLRGLNVLCVENDPGVLDAMETLVGGWGCSITPTRTFFDARAALNSKSFQIVLADYELDYEETGLDILKLAQDVNMTREKRPIQGVLITAEQDRRLEQKAYELGFHYLQKPVEPAALKSIMLNLINTIDSLSDEKT